MQKKFSGIPTKPHKEKNDEGFSINTGKLVTGVVLGVVLVAAATIVSVSGFKAYTRWHNAWNEVQFALDNPELVKELSQRYSTGMTTVKTGLFTPEPATQEAKLGSTSAVETPKVKGGK